MNNTIFRITALVSGILFGMGMAVSGMIDPAKVVGFLDISGNWDPSLAFVMGGALAVFMPSYFLLIKPRKQSVSGAEMCTPTNTKIDARLLSGAAIFGLGWGLAGICPGPAVASLALGNVSIILFFVAMLAGSMFAKLVINAREEKMKTAKA
ncbi:YeeE/YedE family protein [Vibrio natriegens]|uniref:YeeE/YedE family protein n=1 Tax=Vibrio natriegens TaxID=691 RepID=UPI0008043F50|nr:YeeE/YedE family protein [Vibrio natriegens]ANQ29201.1 transporter [Vibrio natriegens]MCY9879247.1 YeeE/YedE family protein [Vibrio natriegens]